MLSKILVVGDSCVDEFVYCSVEKLAPDVPVPVLEELERSTNPGMAANVHRNLKNYFEKVDLVTNSDWQTYTKCRFIDSKTNHMFLRVDRREFESPRFQFSSNLSSYDYIIISDYCKGFLNTEDIEAICSAHNRVFLDSKRPLGKWASKAFLIKINEKEFEISKNFITQNIIDKVICTLGPRGCRYQGRIYPTEEVKVFDTSGAGDSFLAGLIIKFIESANIIESIRFANDCARKSVVQRGVGVI